MPADDPSNPIALADWSFDLPADRIATTPCEPRDACRLLVAPRAPGAALSDHRFTDLEALLRPGDLLVVNDTRVMPARLAARRRSGGAVEILALEPGPGPIAAMVRPARKLRAGEELVLADGSLARIEREAEDGVALVSLPGDPLAVLERLGEMPLPPYLGRAAGPVDRATYQTVFAREAGSAAAPTAGLHFTTGLLSRLESRGVETARVTLHVGIGTFRPLRPEDVARGRLHREPWEVTPQAAEQIARTRAAGGRVIAVGTTAARTLESATPEGARVPLPGRGITDIFIRPGYTFRTVDGLITNFHLPESSLLLLVGALLGRDTTLAAYGHAIQSGYRFYSYGDAMLII